MQKRRTLAMKVEAPLRYAERDEDNGRQLIARKTAKKTLARPVHAVRHNSDD